MKRPHRGDARFDQVLDDFVLPVNSDCLATGKLCPVDVMPLALKADMETIMAKALTLQTSADAHRDQQIHRSLLEHAGPHAVDDVVAASVFDNDGINAVEMKQMT